MLITFDCPVCKSQLKTDSEHVGRQVSCSQCGKLVTVPRRGLEPGAVVGGFRIEALLGKGGMGEIYLARQLSMDRLVALKILPSHLNNRPGLAERFISEIRLQARLEHPNIVTAYEAGDDNGVLYLAMAYIRGESLEARIARSGALAEKRAFGMARKLAGALAYAWNEHRLLHRDIKPANILLDSAGEPKLADMGLAKSLSDGGDLTLPGTLLGSPNYMSPEQAECNSELDARSDIYSLGATLYHALTARIPFGGSSMMETLRKQATESLPDPRTYNPALSESSVRLLECILAKQPGQRHSGWETLIADIDRVLAEQPPLKTPPAPGESALCRTPPPSPPASSSRGRPDAQDCMAPGSAPANIRRLLFSAAGLALLLVILALAVTMSRQRSAGAHQSQQPGSPPLERPATNAKQQMPIFTEIDQAMEYARMHPDDGPGILERLDSVRSRAKGTPMEARVENAIRRHRAFRRERIDNIIRDMQAEAHGLMANGNYAGAEQAVRAFRAPPAPEIEKARRSLLDEIRGKTDGGTGK